MSVESLDEGAAEISDLVDDPILRLLDDEPEAWSSTIDKKVNFSSFLVWSCLILIGLTREKPSASVVFPSLRSPRLYDIVAINVMLLNFLISHSISHKPILTYLQLQFDFISLSIRSCFDAVY